MSTTWQIDFAEPVTAYTATRHATEQLCAPLAVEDYVIQATATGQSATFTLDLFIQ